MNWVISIISLLFKDILAWFKGEKLNEAKSEAAAAKESLKSVGDSLKVEDKIKEEQANVEKEKVERTEGDVLGDNSWNSGSD